MARRVLVTGASGFVGANLARRLLADGHDVHLVLRPSHQPWRVEELRDSVTVHSVDIDDREGLELAFAAARPEWIFHLAAHGAYPQQRDFDRMIVTNVHGTGHLLATAEQAGFDAFVHAGTSSEYGYKDHAPSEHELVEPNSPYAVSKAAATQFCRMTGQRTGLPIRTLRLYSAYGPYEEPTRLIPTLIVEGLQGRLPPLVNPDVARDYAKELETRHVPHVLIKGSSFQEREEIETMRNALNAIEHPDDELSVYATLRGPLFAFSDGELLAFKETVGGLHPFRQIRDGSSESIARIGDALGLLRDLHRGRNRRPFADTISRLLQATRAHAGFAVWPTGGVVATS